MQIQRELITNIDAHKPELPHSSAPAESDMTKVLAIINHRPGYTMREFAAHCNEFYKPSSARSSTACC
jgi:hypothetical protein